MQQLATEFRSLLSTSPSFQKLVKSRKTIAESLFKSSLSFLNQTKLDVYELNQSTRDLRDAIFEMLSTLNKARIPSSLQTEVSLCSLHLAGQRSTTDETVRCLSDLSTPSFVLPRLLTIADGNVAWPRPVLTTPDLSQTDINR
jgi:hypothetical protein